MSPDARRPRRWEEPVDVLGRPFVLLIEGPVPPGRYEVRVWEGRRARRGDPYLRAPIRGRDADEARDRALEVLHNYVGLDRFRLLVEEVAAVIAPGAAVEIGEDAREITVTLAGPFTLLVPLGVAREQVLDRDADIGAVRALVRTHLEAYAQEHRGGVST